MTQILIIIAASIFLLFGILHGTYTLRDLKQPRSFVPQDPDLLEAMKQSGVRFHPEINLWKAWMGFNLSHSLGLIIFGAAFLDIGIFKPQAFVSSLLLQLVAVLVAAIYVILSIKFFFSRPAIGSAVGLVCFTVAAGLAYT